MPDNQHYDTIAHLRQVEAQIEQAKAEGRSPSLIRNLQRERRALREALGPSKES